VESLPNKESTVKQKKLSEAKQVTHIAFKEVQFEPIPKLNQQNNINRYTQFNALCGYQIFQNKQTPAKKVRINTPLEAF
jgi:hypothetical protein